MRLVASLFLCLFFSLQAADKPNILLILSDDQAWTDYSFMGHEQIKTPHLDKLASESVLFNVLTCRPLFAALPL